MTQLNQKSDLQVQDLPFEGKFSLRCRADNLAAVGKALALDLPTRIGDVVEAGGRKAICLGPDEWTIFCSDEDRPSIRKAGEDVYETAIHSLVDVSFRELGLSISGADAAALINTSCPRDLSAIAVGRGTRTLFDTAQVVLLREGENAFRMYVWRSFYPHVRQLLSVGETEFAAGL